MKKRWLLTLFIALWTVSACTEPQPSETVNQPDSTLRVEPFELFAGDAEKFRPFLGDMAGAVKWRYTGEKTKLQITAEIWENGVKTGDLTSMGVTLPPTKTGMPSAGELLISLQDLSSIDPAESQAETTTYVATVSCYLNGSGSSTNTFLVPASSRHQMRMSLQLREPVKVADDAAVSVWGVKATDENSMTSTDSLPDAPTDAKWAIVFRISAEDE